MMSIHSNLLKFRKFFKTYALLNQKENLDYLGHPFIWNRTEDHKVSYTRFETIVSSQSTSYSSEELTYIFDNIVEVFINEQQITLAKYIIYYVRKFYTLNNAPSLIKFQNKVLNSLLHKVKQRPLIFIKLLALKYPEENINFNS